MSTPSSETGSGTSRLTSASTCSGGPSSASGTPFARCAAAGLKRSRPWNVRDTACSAYSGLASSWASAIPARLAAGSRSPLSGPTKRRPASSRSASGRRGPPTPGSTTARCTPTGMYAIVFARHERALQHRLSGNAVRDVDDLRFRRDRLHDSVARAHEIVLEAEVAQERDEHARSVTPKRRGSDSAAACVRGRAAANAVGAGLAADT